MDMKILFLAAANSVHTIKWVNELADRGHDVHLAYNAGHDPSVDFIVSTVKLYRLKFYGTQAYYLNAREVKKIITKIKPDVVNAHYASGYGTLARIARAKPLIISIWGSDVYEFPFLNKINFNIVKKNLLYAEQIASTSRCMAKKTREIIGSKKKSITITPFGVDLEKFNPNLFEKHKEEETLKVGVIKSLEEMYGIADFLKAMALVVNELEKREYQKKIEIEIYGEGSQKENLINLSVRLGIEHIVKFGGKIPNKDVPKTLSKLSVFCNTTKTFESFGVSIVEAMAMKIPVVVTDVEGSIEITQNGETGFVVHAGDIDEMANSIVEIILNDKVKETLGEKERKRVEKEYDWGKNVDVMERLYRKVILHERNRNVKTGYFVRNRIDCGKKLTNKKI